MYITFSFSYPQFYISSGVIHGSVFYSVTNYHHGYHIVYIYIVPLDFVVFFYTDTLYAINVSAEKNM